MSAELAPDRSAFFLTFVVSEGERYRVDKISVEFEAAQPAGRSARRRSCRSRPGDWYDGDAVERSTQAIQDDVQNHGYRLRRGEPARSRATR